MNETFSPRKIYDTIKNKLIDKYETNLELNHP